MEDLLGFILEFVLEMLIQIVFEAGVDAASRAYRPREDAAAVLRSHRRFRFVPFLHYALSRTNPPFTILKFTLLGFTFGFVSVLVLPHPLVHPSKFHGISLLISPVITGLIMGFIGRTVRRRGKAPVQIESFAYGFTFAFAFALIRFLMVP
jgi:H+/Cl- antiporter ClcA